MEEEKGRSIERQQARMGRCESKIPGLFSVVPPSVKRTRWFSSKEGRDLQFPGPEKMKGQGCVLIAEEGKD